DRLDEKYKLKNLDMWGNTTAFTNEVTETFGNMELELESGEYYLLFRSVGENDNFAAYEESGNKYLEVWLKSFKLLPKEAIPVDEMTGFSLSSEATTLMAGENTKLISNEVWSLSGNKPVTEGVTYKSSDDRIATVSSDGVVTAVAKGEVTITATLDATDFSDTVTITVKEYERATKVYTYNFNRDVFGSTGHVQRDALAEMTFDTVDAALSSPWKTAATAYVYNTFADPTGLIWNAYQYRADSGAAAYGLELKVPESGTYIPKLAYHVKETSPITDVYLIKNDGTLPEFVYGASGNGSGVLTTYLSSLNGKNMLAKIDMYSEKAETKTAVFDEVYLDSDYTYYLMFHPTGKNENFKPLVSGDREFFEVKPISFEIKPLAGDFDKASISVHGLLDENDPMPNMTEKQIEYKLYDDVGIELDEVDATKLSATYSSSDENVATVSDSGLVTAHSNGETKITANITYKGVTRSAEYNLIVASAGRNMMAHLNPDFTGDEWVWEHARNDEPPAEPILFRAGIETAPKAGDENNRALAFNFNPDVPMPSDIIATILLKRNGERVVVEPGKFYQLTLKVKTNIKKPEDGEYPIIRYNVYAYNSPTGTSSAYLAHTSGWTTDINNFENWNETFSEWQEVAVPIYVDTNVEAETLYLSPRLNIRAPSSSAGKAGYSGTIWMDDFELREVGFAGVEMEILDGSDVGSESEFTVFTKPYTTLGHYISVTKGVLADGLVLTSSDANVVSGFKDSTTYQINHIPIGSTGAECGGKNGTATIFGELTLEGITRKGEVSVTTSGHEMKLLYAGVKTEPESIAVGGSARIIPTGYMSDGSVADMTGGKIVYDSLTPDIVSVDDAGNITTLRAGKGKVYAAFMLDGNNAYAETEIEVTDSSPIESAVLSAPGTVGHLRDEPLILTGKMKSGYDADFTNAEIKWLIGSNPADGVTIDEENRLIFGNVKGAMATISAEITMGGATVSTNEIKVEVVESDLRDFILNFGGAHEKKIANVTIDKYGWQVDWNLSHSSVKGAYLYNTYLSAETSGVNCDFAVDFTVPYTGNYTPVFAKGKKDGYGAEYVNIYIDGKYVGETSYCRENLRGTSDIFNLRSMYLEKGTHKLVLRPYAEKEESRNYYLHPSYIRFAAISSLPAIREIEAAKDSFIIEVDGTEELSVKIKTDDGFVYSGQSEFGGAADSDIAISYASADSAVAAVSENGTITALGLGETNITVTVKVNGDVKKKEIPVKVVEKGASTENKTLYKVEIDAPFFVMNPETEGVQLEVIGKDKNGETVDITGAEIKWMSENESVAEVSAEGYVVPKGLGSATILVVVTMNGSEKRAEAYISVRGGKTGRTYYTDEMVAAAQENIQKYNWAKSEAEAVIESA
ncbi:MAG: Ig-like domain-containing protein, partial [Oscillospiraceae bacterium]|nr:Ig-like domain-containing protein [Oscillospiraceae bacterium]